MIDLTRAQPGEPDGWKAKDEADHFVTCGQCNQAIDCRNLEEVFYHETPGHQPRRVQ